MFGLSFLVDKKNICISTTNKSMLTLNSAEIEHLIISSKGKNGISSWKISILAWILILKIYILAN